MVSAVETNLGVSRRLVKYAYYVSAVVVLSGLFLEAQSVRTSVLLGQRIQFLDKPHRYLHCVRFVFFFPFSSSTNSPAFTGRNATGRRAGCLSISTNLRALIQPEEAGGLGGDERRGDGRGRREWRRRAGASAGRRRPAAQLGRVDARGVRVEAAQEGARRRRPRAPLARRLLPLQALAPRR
jgi:hypothetical protein